MRVILKRKKILQALDVWDMLQHVNNNSVQCKHNVKALSVAFFTLSAHETKWLNTRGLTCIIIQKSSSFEWVGGTDDYVLLIMLYCAETSLL